MTRPSLLVALHSASAHAEGNRWTVDGREVSQGQSTLLEFAECLAVESGGPRVRTVVFVSDEEKLPRILARSPRQVCQISRAEALAHCAPENWDRFLVIDTGEAKRAAVVVRSDAGFAVLEILCDAKGIGFLAGPLGISRCLWASDVGTETDSPDAELLSKFDHVSTVDGQSSLVLGSIKFAKSVFAREGGVSFGPELTNSLCVTRTTGYSVHRPLLGVFHPDDKTLATVIGTRPAFLVVDDRVARLHGRSLAAYATRHLNLVGELSFDVAEASKTLQSAERICEAALQAGLPRNGVILGVGGGITLDVAGFAASIFRRGVGYVRVPTTLVGLSDVAVGIKQGVNAWGKKNILGAFYAPLASVNDYQLLTTLPLKEIACGMAEITKIALLRDPDLFDLLDWHSDELLSSHFQAPSGVAEDISIRAELLMLEELAPNLFESELARLVDFGHTFSPAIESGSQYSIPHGAAVALDIMLSLAVAVHRGMADPVFLHRVVRLFNRLGFGIEETMCTTAEMWAALEHVKQHRGGSLNLVIVSGPGQPSFINDLERSELEAAVSSLQQRFFRSTSLLPKRRFGFVRAAV